MRVVADTNTIVSGLGWRGSPAQVFDAALAGDLTLITSPALRDELSRVLRYPKLTSVFSDPDRIVNLLGATAETVHPSLLLAVVDDEPDNRVLEAAVTGQADAIVTGDDHLLALGSFREVPILTTTALLARLPDRGT
jgi:putative PIN family toxin of toxin-antitoxin system